MQRAGGVAALAQVVLSVATLAIVLFGAGGGGSDASAPGDVGGVGGEALRALQTLEVIKVLLAAAGLVVVFGLTARLYPDVAAVPWPGWLGVAAGGVAAALLLASAGVGYASLTLFELFPRAEEAPGATALPVSVVSSALNAVVSGLGAASVFATGCWAVLAGRGGLAVRSPLAAAERRAAGLGAAGILGFAVPGFVLPTLALNLVAAAWLAAVLFGPPAPGAGAGARGGRGREPAYVRPLLRGARRRLPLPALVDVGDDVVDRQAVGLDVQHLGRRGGLVQQGGDVDPRRRRRRTRGARPRSPSGRRPSSAGAAVGGRLEQQAAPVGVGAPQARRRRRRRRSALGGSSRSARPAASSSDMSWLVTITVTPPLAVELLDEVQDVALAPARPGRASARPGTGSPARAAAPWPGRRASSGPGSARARGCGRRSSSPSTSRDEAQGALVDRARDVPDHPLPLEAGGHRVVPPQLGALAEDHADAADVAHAVAHRVHAQRAHRARVRARAARRAA